MAEGKPAILIIEDEKPIRSFLGASLGSQGYRLIEAVRGEEGVALAASHVPDLVILDLGLPDIDGLEVIRRLREWSQVPIIILSARDKEHDKIEALERGADDYLSKPFGVGELIARIRVALRHAARLRSAPDASPSVYAAGRLEVDLEKRRVAKDGREVHLTPIEFKLLSVLVKNAGRVLTHGFLLREVWGTGNPDQSHYVRIFMANLRRKIEDDPAQPRLLTTETGVGYRMLEPGSP